MKHKSTFVFSIIAIVTISYLSWLWVFCRFYVPPNYMAVIISKMGKALPDGEILAEKGQKGIWKEVLGEGRYFFNPVVYDWEIMPITKINTGKIGIVTSKVGESLPEGEFLAEKGQKGIQKTVLSPGKYRINPYGYEITLHDALEIPIGYVGIVTSLSGTKVPDGLFAELGQKGVFSKVLQPGLYYINPKQYKIDIMEVGTNQISLLGNKPGEANYKPDTEILRTKTFDNLSQNLIVQSDVLQERMDKAEAIKQSYKDSFFGKSVRSVNKKEEKMKRNVNKMDVRKPEKNGSANLPQNIIQVIEFPSKDGFNVCLDMTVEFEFLPENAASIFMKYGDLFQVVEKIILPQILSVSRLKGSAYGARDFIAGEGREKFQDELVLKLQESLSQKGIQIFSALIRNVIVPEEIRIPIQEASISIERNLTNIEKQDTAKKLAELNIEVSLIEQRREQVEQETKKMKAEIKAFEEKEVASINAETLKQVSEVEKATAEVQADKIRKIAKAENEILEMVGLAEAEGFRKKVTAFGDSKNYILYEAAKSIPKDMNLIMAHTGDGTLWTDLDKSLAGDLGGLKILEKK